jgi:hypothetical protein
MKTLSKLSLLAAFAIFSAFGQTVVPNTTTCAAVALTDRSVCLTSTTNVVKNTGLYIDNEYMTVLATPTGSSSVYVAVARGNLSLSAAPAAHSSGTVVWLALTPDKAVVPGANGFDFGAQLGDYGPCVRTSITYLPHIWPNRGVIRDCNGVTGQWVNYSEFGALSTNGTLQLLAASGAIQPTGGNYLVTKAGVAALTLAAPTAGIQDGAVLRISSTTANAHTITATGLLQSGTASVNVATFAAQAGAGLILMAYNGKWIVLSSVGITFS